MLRDLFANLDATIDQGIYPGLDTVVMRSMGRLVIQNDIGTTDALVVVIAVERNSVTVTYTDMHLPRAKFFIGLFRKYPA
jgi:hypothetical protein